MLFSNLNADCNSVVTRLIRGKIKTPAPTGISTAFVLDRHAHAGVCNSDFATFAFRCAIWAATDLLIGFAARSAKNPRTRIANPLNKIAASTPPNIVKYRIDSPLNIICLSQHRPQQV